MSDAHTVPARGASKTRRDAAFRVLVVDDRGPVGDATVAAVEGADPRVRAVRVDRLPALEAALRSRDWDAAVVAADLPRAPLEACIDLLHRVDPTIQVLVTTEAPGEEVAMRAVRAGAREVLDARRPELVAEAVTTLLPTRTSDGSTSRAVAATPHVRALAALARDLGTAGTVVEALEAVVHHVAHELALPYVESWLPLPDGSGMGPGPASFRDDAGSLRQHADGAAAIGRPSLVRSVATTNRSVTLHDLGSSAAGIFSRAERALALGFASAHATPVPGPAETGAVLVALSGPERPLTTDDVLTLDAAAAHAGETLRRLGGAHGVLHAESRLVLLDQVGDGILACAADGRLTLVNQAMEVLLEGALQVGTPLASWASYPGFLDEASAPLPPERLPLVRALGGATFEDEEHQLVAASGRRRTVRVSGQPIADADGARGGAVVVYRDVTDRVASEAAAAAAAADALATYRLLLDDLADLARRVGEADTLDEVWFAVLEFVHHALGADALEVARRTAADGVASLFAGSFGGGHVAMPAPTDAVTLGALDRCVRTGAGITLPAAVDAGATSATTAVPMVLGGRILGALAVRTPTGRPMDERTATALTMVANLAAVALDHADLVEGERRARQAAEVAAGRFAQVFRASPAAIAISSLRDDRILDANPALEDLIGFGRDELVGARAVDLGIWVDPAERAEAAAGVGSGGSVRGIEVRLRRKDGAVRTCLMSADATTLDGEAAMLCLMVDATERLEQQDRLRTLATFRESLMSFISQTLDVGFDGAFYQRLLESAVAATPGAQAGSLLVRDGDADTYHFVAAVGYDLDGLRAITFFDPEIAQATGDGGPAVTTALPTVRERSHRSAALRRYGRLDQIKSTISIPISLEGRRVAALSLDNFDEATAFDEESQQLATAFATQVAALIKRRALERELEHMAYHDSLTGLPNRLLFRDRLKQAIGRANRTGRRGAAIFLDVDNLKVTNDALGHAVGDRLLQAVGTRLAGVVRSDDTVARIGGDEFTMVLPDVGDAAAAATVAEKILKALRDPFELDTHVVHVTASIGITVFPDDGTDADALIQHGDAAMYGAKAQGKDRYRFFTQEMNRELIERATLEAQLRTALERDEFSLHFQPRVRLDDGAITSVEALARWLHPGRGWVPPGTFVPVAEDAGLIGAIGDRLLRLACRQARAWMDAGTPVRVAFNLSARQLQERDVVRGIRSALDDHGVPGHLLEIELTESALMRNVGENVLKLDELRAMGISISIDDFGTAYSSLNYLKRLPATSLKIDRSFVGDVEAGGTTVRDAAIVHAVVALASALQLTAIAEGVETAAQLRFLRSLGCEQGQGFLFGRPVPAAQLDSLVRAGRVDLPDATGR